MGGDVGDTGAAPRRKPAAHDPRRCGVSRAPSLVPAPAAAFAAWNPPSPSHVECVLILATGGVAAVTVDIVLPPLSSDEISSTAGDGRKG